ncbi:hypothetical protein HJC23_011176 [Cyclotella cryptica]|uniref:Uncharacterized protein n=1 Tax=Cyclotella cryptica TaxID=29204 RepID=A0ABD3PA15_9STRA|eukprot:CCRYP_016222-RA/>CCRYP_016222-RA protein AED:0.16 eAED:0.16 QI:0/0.5/0.33/1/1/1/3/180/412
MTFTALFALSLLSRWPSTSDAFLSANTVTSLEDSMKLNNPRLHCLQCNRHITTSENIGTPRQPPKYININDEDDSRILRNRRVFLTASSLAVSSSVLWGTPSVSNAAKGAAEYDLEYYFRDLVFGNKPEGNLPASTSPPVAPPRTLQGPLLGLLLDDELQSCIPVQELSKIVPGISVLDISNQTKDIRSKVQPAFRSRYPWREEAVSDAHFFDCTAYSLWKVASALTSQDYIKRDHYVRNIGRRILNEMIGREILSKESIAILDRKSGDKGPSLTGTIPCALEILNIFQSAEFCSSFRLGDKNDEYRTGTQLFDDLDDQEIIDGGSVNCLVSIFNPATLGGSLQITGEGSRFAPDFVGPTLAAVWERVDSGGKNTRIEVTFESYFVDPVYRPNPKDFFPDERLYQFTIASKR